MAKNDKPKILVRAKQRLISRATDTFIEAGETYYVNPETADQLIALGLVELAEQTHKAEEITKEE
jgi:hypothetical protein